MKRLIFVIFLSTNWAVSTFGQGSNLTSTTWWCEITSYSEFLEKDTIVLYGSEIAQIRNSYFEFKKTSDFTFFTDRRSEYDSINQFTEELITPVTGTYQLKKNSLKIVFTKPYRSTTARIYLVSFQPNDELRLINAKRKR